MDRQIIIKKALLAASVIVVSASDALAAGDADFSELESKKQPEKIQALSQTLPIVLKKTGPFGLSQDLSVKKVTKVTPKQVVKADVFPKAIGGIPINGVSGHSFLSGAREYREGQTFSLVFGKNKFNVKVISVRASQIQFKNMATGELVIKPTGALPQAFTPDKGLQDVEGVTPTNQGTDSIEVKGNTNGDSESGKNNNRKR